MIWIILSKIKSAKNWVRLTKIRAEQILGQWGVCPRLDEFIYHLLGKTIDLLGVVSTIYIAVFSDTSVFNCGMG